MALAPTLDSLPVLHGEINRLSSGGSEKITAKEPSVCTVEEYLGWGEGGDGEPLVPPSGDGDGDGVGDSKEGAFTDSALMMARLRLPNMDLGYEVDGFFGIDVRSLIIEKEIARGAFGVVFEGLLLPHPPEEEGGGVGGGGDRSGVYRLVLECVASYLAWTCVDYLVFCVFCLGAEYSRHLSCLADHRMVFFSLHSESQSFPPTR